MTTDDNNDDDRDDDDDSTKTAKTMTITRTVQMMTTLTSNTTIPRPSKVFIENSKNLNVSCL